MEHRSITGRQSFCSFLSQSQSAWTRINSLHAAFNESLDSPEPCWICFASEHSSQLLVSNAVINQIGYHQYASNDSSLAIYETPGTRHEHAEQRESCGGPSPIVALSTLTARQNPAAPGDATKIRKLAGSTPTIRPSPIPSIAFRPLLENPRDDSVCLRFESVEVSRACNQLVIQCVFSGPSISGFSLPCTFLRPGSLGLGIDSETGLPFGGEYFSEFDELWALI